MQFGTGKPYEKDVARLFCNVNHSEDKREEEWTWCFMCEIWVHGECAGYDSGCYNYDHCELVPRHLSTMIVLSLYKLNIEGQKLIGSPTKTRRSTLWNVYRLIDILLNKQRLAHLVPAQVITLDSLLSREISCIISNEPRRSVRDTCAQTRSTDLQSHLSVLDVPRNRRTCEKIGVRGIVVS